MQTTDDRKNAAAYLTAMADVGEAAMEYMEAESYARTAREDYRAARDAFLGDVNPERTLRVSAFLDNPDFQCATGARYAEYVEARRQARNAKRRLETQFRKAKAGGMK